MSIAVRSCEAPPDLERSFKVPFSPLLPWLSAAICVFLMLNLTAETWLRFMVWMALGFAIYFAYGYKHSRVGQGQACPRRLLRARLRSHPGPR